MTEREINLTNAALRERAQWASEQTRGIRFYSMQDDEAMRVRVLALRDAAWREQRELDAALLRKTKHEGGTVWPHACSSCGLTDEEWHDVDIERRALTRAAAAIRAAVDTR